MVRISAKAERKHTGWVDFYDSAHDKAAKGLEISNLGVIDVTANTGYSLSARQTPPQAEIEALIAEQGLPPRADQEEADEISRVDF